MKKVYYFAAIVLALSVLFACTLPSSMEIIGNPSLLFGAKMDFNEMFSSNVKNGFGNDDSGNTVIECTNTKYQTFIIHMNLFKNVIGGSLITATTDLVEDANGNVETYKEDVLSDSNDGSPSPDPINLGHIFENMEGFKFKKVNSKLFISGSHIVGELKINLKIGDEPEHKLDKKTGFIPEESGFNKDEWEKFTALPNRGELVDLTNQMSSGQDIEIEYKVILPEKRKFPAEWIHEEAEVHAELVIWLTLELTAKNECEHEGADLNLAYFMGEMSGDFFGRESEDSEGSMTDFFESINMAIEFSEEAFDGAILYFESDNGRKPISISYKLTDKQLNFKFDEKTMKKINNPAYFPFEPKFLIHFNRGDDLHIPRNFKSNFIKLEAKLNYTIDLLGNDE